MVNPKTKAGTPKAKRSKSSESGPASAPMSLEQIVAAPAAGLSQAPLDSKSVPVETVIVAAIQPTCPGAPRQTYEDDSAGIQDVIGRDSIDFYHTRIELCKNVLCGSDRSLTNVEAVTMLRCIFRLIDLFREGTFGDDVSPSDLDTWQRMLVTTVGLVGIQFGADTTQLLQDDDFQWCYIESFARKRDIEQNRELSREGYYQNIQSATRVEETRNALLQQAMLSRHTLQPVKESNGLSSRGLQGPVVKRLASQAQPKPDSKDGSVELLEQRDDSTSNAGSPPGSDAQSNPVKPKRVRPRASELWHSATIVPHEDFRQNGPLMTATKIEMSMLILGTKDHRRLNTLIRSGILWGRENVRGKSYSAWFKHRIEFNNARSKQIRIENEKPKSN